MTRRRIKKRELDNERVAALAPTPVVLPESIPELPSVFDAAGFTQVPGPPVVAESNPESVGEPIVAPVVEPKPVVKLKPKPMLSETPVIAGEQSTAPVAKKKTKKKPRKKSARGY